MRKCDEINVEYNDRNIIPTLVEQYPDKWIKVNTHLVHNIDWKSIDTYNKLTQGKFIISLAFPEGAVECKERNIKFMLGTYIDTFDKLMAAKELGAYEALIGGAICFDIRRASKQGIKLRMCINQAQTDSIPRVNGVVGSWVRPEDLHMYDEFIDIAEIAS